jgi:hypothetical protein
MMKMNRYSFKPFALSFYSLLPQAGEGLGMRGCEYKVSVCQLDIPHPNPSPACGRGTCSMGA